ncbi:flagellar biogenesis protein [Qipengyuania sp. S6317L1]|uniref:flagellar biogenesis protein n=1 Tax=Qipengyuania sp. S6317L1 TaxID=2926410 RepID=UPI001FF2C9CF|nr:flagellar biogenesis protein [Qipengyuania sp. S6317L1]MCK0097881.1 flagellar biogenesis protein [Qipengyuania sp. S6317L1]
MAEYLLRLALLLPLLGLMIWGSLKLTRYLQTRLVGLQGGSGSLELVETNLLAPGLKLAVVRFHDREILLGCSRSGIVRLGEADAHGACEPAILPADTEL